MEHEKKMKWKSRTVVGMGGDRFHYMEGISCLSYMPIYKYPIDQIQ